MKSLEEFNRAVQKVVGLAQNINEEVSAEMWTKAPVIVHQKICSEVVEIVKKYKDQSIQDVEKKEPELTKLFTAMDVLERLYPELKEQLIKDVA